MIKIIQELELDSINSFADATKKLSERISDKRLVLFLLKNLKKTDNKFRWKINTKVLFEKLPELSKAISFQNIDSPTLFIRGEKSDYIIDDDISEIKSKFNDSEIITFENSGHWIHAEEPNKLIEIIKVFFN